MINARLHDPTTIDTAAIEAVIASGRTPIVQFSRPGYSPQLLAQLNALCAQHGERLHVRFFGHHGHAFDAAVLRQLPEVRWLELDSLTAIAHEGEIGALPHLQRLRFGVFRFDQPQFLQTLDVSRLTQLTLAENDKRNIDLAPLADAANLEKLFIQGHAKNVEVIAGLPTLHDLGLSGFPKRHDLAFLNRLAPLRTLLLILGSRASIEEFEHPGLEDLSIIWVRQLAALGPLRRFARLQRLKVEDQLQLRALDVAGAPLSKLAISNCKNLAAIHGLESLDQLVAFHADRTALDLDALVERPWPQSLEVLGLLSGSRKWNATAKARIEARGYRLFPAPAA